MNTTVETHKYHSKIAALASHALELFAFMIIPAFVILQDEGISLLLILFGICSIIFSIRLVYPVFPKIIAVSVLAFMGWATLTATWSIYPPIGYLWGALFMAMTVSGIFWVKLIRWADAYTKIALLQFFTLGLIIAQSWLILSAALAYFGIFEDSTVIAHERLFALCLGFWPAANYIYKAYGATATKTFLYFTLLSFFALHQAGLGIILLGSGLLAYAITTKSPKLTKQIVYFGLGLFMILTSLVALYSVFINNPSHIAYLPPQLQEAYAAWRGAINIGLQHPFLGAGIGSYEFNTIAEIVSPTLIGQLHSDSSIARNDIHNPFLMIWLELGFIGIACFLILVTRLTKKMNGRHKASLPIFTAFAIIASIELVAGFGIWNSWWFASIWFFVPLILIQENLLIPLKN